MLSVCLSVFVCSEYTGTYVLIKSVESKVPTALAYGDTRSTVGSPLKCRPRHLTRVLNYEAYMAVLKLYLRLEICSRKRSNQANGKIPVYPTSDTRFLKATKKSCYYIKNIGLDNAAVKCISK